MPIASKDAPRLLRPGGGNAAAAKPVPVRAAAEPATAFPLDYLPPAAAGRFREALACYRHGLWQAFAAMCRSTAQAAFGDGGETGRARLFDQLNEIQTLAEVDEPTFTMVRQVIFADGGATRATGSRDVNRWQAAVLLETMKDLLQQNFVRPAKLRQALKVRQAFADPEGLDAQATKSRAF